MRRSPLIGFLGDSAAGCVGLACVVAVAVGRGATVAGRVATGTVRGAAVVDVAADGRGGGVVRAGGVTGRVVAGTVWPCVRTGGVFVAGRGGVNGRVVAGLAAVVAGEVAPRGGRAPRAGGIAADVVAGLRSVVAAVPVGGV